MAIYVLIAEQCKQEAITLGFWTAVEKLQEKIEYIQNTGGLARYPQPFMVKKFGKTGRMVIEEKIIDADCLLCFLRFFVRSDPDYWREFLGKPALFHQENTPNDDICQEYLEIRRKKPVKSIPSLTPLEENYLYSLDHSSYQEEGSILESEEWVARMQSPEYTSYHSHYWNLVFSLVDEKFDRGQTIIPNERRTILFRHFPELKKWFLIAPLNINDPEDEQRLRKKYDAVFSEEKQIDESDLLRRGKRSYPAVMVYDDDIWVNRIEASKTANMSLSPEEVGVLDSILYKEGEGYPLFINGRPGSGKSTVLQYLFAEHLYHHLSLSTQDRLTAPPIYLTYNDSLLRRAKETIGDILRCDSKKVNERPVNLDDKVLREIFDNAFGHFHEFLYKLLAPDEQKKLSQSEYINYSRFRQMWNAKYSKSPDPEIRKLSPELAWHTIRTFIKGMRQEGSDYFDVDSYKIELPRDQKTVTSEVFERIYQLWDSWYRPLCEDEGYWDDQDLTWKVLSNENINLSRYPAIFCDESQDFTYIELDLIFKLSIYSQKQVPSYLLPRVPFAFAGDPFQTLNPTGFNWQATQANFHDKIVRQLDKNQSTKLIINFRELGFNYRSTVNIVQFCNLIQLLRGIAFEIPNLYPQSTWFRFNQSTNILAYFDDSDQVGRALIQDQAELVIIIPCQEGEEKEFVQNDIFLKTVALDANGELIRNIQSPIRAKGLDFQRVVLYKFGQECVEKYPQLIRIIEDENPPHLSDDEKLPLEYFVNRLYVAASRPKSRLFIIDTEKGLEEFWGFAKDVDLKKFLARYPHKNTWSVDDNLAKIQRGNRENWEQDRDNAEELGDQFFKDGKEKRDIYQLRQAMINYRACNPPKEDKAQECQALIFEFEENYQKAGDQYLSMNSGNQALRCYWIAQSFKSILDLGKRDANQINTLEHRAASFMESQKSLNECEKFLDNIFQRVSQEDDFRTKIITDDVWISIINKIVEQLGSANETEIQNMGWNRIYAEIEFLKNKGVNIKVILELAKIAFLAGNFPASRELLNQVKLNLQQSPTWIIQVFAETTAYPNNLEYLERMTVWERIIDEYKNHLNIDLKNNQAEIIFKTLLKEEALEPALSFVKQYPSPFRYGRLIVLSLNLNNGSRANQLAESLIADFVNNGSWSEAIEFASKGRIEKMDNDLIKSIQNSEIDENWRNVQLIKVLAISDRLSGEATVHDKDEVSKYLNKVLLQGKQGQLINRLAVSEAGASIERANKLTDALAFYENVISGKWGKNSIDIKLARVRWIICKRRQLNLMENPKAQRRVDDEIKKNLADWNISDSEIKTQPEFPLVLIHKTKVSEGTAISHISKYGDDIQITFQERKYICRAFTKNQKIEIRDTETENLVIAYFGRGELACPDEPSLLSKIESVDRITWMVKGWNIQITFIHKKDHYDIVIHSKDSSEEIYKF